MAVAYLQSWFYSQTQMNTGQMHSWRWTVQSRKRAKTAERVGMQTQQPSWICYTCISSLPAPSFCMFCQFLSSFSSCSIQRPFSLTPNISSASLLLIPLSLLYEPLFTNQLRPNYTQLAPHLLPTGALEGQKILMLTDVNLHDFLASISTTVVCLLVLYRKLEEKEEEGRGRRGRTCQYLVMLCNLEQ